MRRHVLTAFLLAGALAAKAGAPASNRLPDGTEITRYEVQVDPSFHVPYRGEDAGIRSGFPKGFPLSIGSGLAYAGQGKDGALQFWGLTDRGPNGDAPDYRNASDRTTKTKVFPSPAFVPSLVRIEVRKGVARVVSTLPLRTPTGPASGLPLPEGHVGATGELALSEHLKVLKPSTHLNGLDPEGVTVDPTNPDVLWLCDEYGPFILRVDARTGAVLQTFAPGSGLPSQLRFRQPNRGFEGIAVAPDGKVYAIVQSILDFEQALAGSAHYSTSKSRFLRIVELDPRTGATRTFAYPHDVDQYGKSKDAKIGDLAALGRDRFLVLEQGEGRDGVMRNRIHLVDLAAATDLGSLPPTARAPEAIAKDTDLAALGVVFPRKSLVFDLRAPGSGWEAEKAEGLAVLPDGRTLAVANDNDFGLRATMTGPALPSEDPGKYLLMQNGDLRHKGEPVTAAYRLAPGRAEERPSRLWMIRLPKPLDQY